MPARTQVPKQSMFCGRRYCSCKSVLYGLEELGPLLMICVVHEVFISLKSVSPRSELAPEERLDESSFLAVQVAEAGDRQSGNHLTSPSTGTSVTIKKSVAAHSNFLFETAAQAAACTRCRSRTAIRA